jgi:Uri superfamily endonuclease
MKGAYVLLLSAEENAKVKVGSLGEIKLAKGHYAYVGSALGRGLNLEKRVQRHKRLAETKAGCLRWHIDYLLASPSFRWREAILIESSEPLECAVSRRLEALAEAVIPKFGSSDCKNACRGHLHYLGTRPLREIRDILENLRLNLRHAAVKHP